MKIRKVGYNIDFVHVITFKEHYREIVAPYFNFDNLQYGIDNENTLHESIRLIFKNEGFTLQFRMDGATLIYEGDVALLRKQNAVTEIFLDIVDKIKKIPGFSKVSRHKITLNFVDVLSKEEVDEILKKNKYLINPFGELEEFATVYEFNSNGNKCRLQFGNYTYADVEKYDLTPFKSEYNSDLTKEAVGLMAQLTMVEDIASPSMSKLKNLIEESDKLLAKYAK